MNEVLNREQFDVLEQYAIQTGNIPQKNLAEITKLSVDSINVVLRKLSERDLIDEKGLRASGIRFEDESIVMTKGQNKNI